MKPVIVTLLFLLTASALPLAAQAEPAARCYRFSIPSPAREADAPPRSERWCYQQLTSGGTYIYNADTAKVRPELALLKSEQGSITQASLAAGKIRYLNSALRQFNPLSVPLAEPQDRRADSLPATAAFEESAQAVLAQLEKVARGSVETAASPLAATASYLPWRGYWWPLKNMPMLVPLGKFDAFVRAHGGEGGAVAWEQTHHVSHGVWWEGHCNGWAAASILRAEPRVARKDDSSGLVFSVSQLKGIATETDFCSTTAFYGYRHRGNSGVSPKEFHGALLYYIGRLHKPIAFNIRSDGPIDNRVISGYSMQTESSGGGTVVTTTLNYHVYDGKITDLPGTAPAKTVTYRYRLPLTDGEDTGTWLSKRPGFVWVPLSTGGECKNGNPGMKADYVNGLLGH